MDDKLVRYMILGGEYCQMDEESYQKALTLPNFGVYALVGSREELQRYYPGCTEFIREEVA